MDELSMKFNKMIMEEIGLEVRDHRRIYDQDSGSLIRIDDKDLVAPGSFSGRFVQEFDPYNNNKQMAQLFSYFTDKITESGEIENYDVVYNVEYGQNKGKIEMKNDSDKISSGVYVRDQCRYADLILRLNGDDSPDLKEFDIPKTKESIKRKSVKRNSKKKVEDNGNSTK